MIEGDVPLWASPLGRRRLLVAGAALSLAAVGSARASGAEVKVRRQQVGPLPTVDLMSMQGQAVTLEQALGGSSPLLLNFVFTTCSSSCSMQTAQLVQVRRQWLAQGRTLKLASISIDPDNDTPAQLLRFAGSFGITDGWGFYTGRFDDLLRVQRHFDVYRGSKSAHPPVLLMRAGPLSPWLRIEGFPETASLLAQLRELSARA